MWTYGKRSLSYSKMCNGVFNWGWFSGSKTDRADFIARSFFIRFGVANRRCHRWRRRAWYGKIKKTSARRVTVTRLRTFAYRKIEVCMSEQSLFRRKTKREINCFEAVLSFCFLQFRSSVKRDNETSQTGKNRWFPVFFCIKFKYRTLNYT